MRYSGWRDKVALSATPRPAQQRLLDLGSVPEVVEDGRIHLAAPPGSGKTLVGLELARRLGNPTLVLVPNAHLVDQWAREFARRFTVSGDEGPTTSGTTALVSTDPRQPGTITITTYQALSVPARGGTPLDALAEQAWVEELTRDGTPDPEAWLEQHRAEDPARHRRLLRARVRDLRRNLTRRGEMEVTPLLHANSRAALTALAEARVATVVLDECHHLLDHWAMVVTEFVEAMQSRAPDEATVIGMTATLPEPASSHQQVRYEGLLGPVDVEIPVPTVVSEGGLAPFRQISVATPLTADERRLVDRVSEAFRTTSMDVTSTEAFRSWLVTLLHDRTADEDTWSRWLVDDPAGSRAVLRAHTRWGLVLPTAMPVPPDAHEPLDDADLLLLLGRFHRDVLVGARDPDLVATRRALGQATAAFGLQLTRKGVRQGRAPVDQLLVRSDAKAHAAAAILSAEAQVLGDDLRALVAVDFDRAPHPHALLRGVLEEDGGSARRLHRLLVLDPRSAALDPVLVTARTVRVGNVLADELEVAVNLALAASGSPARCLASPVDDRIQDLLGPGSNATSRQVLPILTRLLTDGTFRCLVATRGLVGQGWDCPPLNVLVDLTQAASPVASPQLHGRTMRLDPERPDKVAHNYDVVARAPTLPGGEADLRRWTRRHEHLWRLEVDPPPSLARGDVAGADLLDASDLAHVAGGRDAVRRAWAEAAPAVAGTVRREVVVAGGDDEADHDEVRRVRGASLWPGMIGATAVTAAATAGALALGAAVPVVVGGAFFGFGPVLALASLPQRGRGRRLLGRLPRTTGDQPLRTEAMAQLLFHLGEATRDGLVAAGAVPPRAATAAVAVIGSGGHLRVRLDPPREGPPLLTAVDDTMAQSLVDLLGGAPGLLDARYALAVRLGRAGVRHLPLPTIVGTKAEPAHAFAAAFGASLHAPTQALFLRNPAGRKVLLEALDSTPRPLGAGARHVWA